MPTNQSQPELQYRKKPIVVEARQLTTGNRKELVEWIHAGSGKLPQGAVSIFIPTLEGLMCADVGDWIIRGIRGEFYPCKPDIFAETYEPAHPLGRAGDGGAELEFGGLKVRVDPTMPPDAVRFETPIPRAVPQGAQEVAENIQDLAEAEKVYDARPWVGESWSARIDLDKAAALIQQYADSAVAEIKQTLPYFHETQRLRKEADILQAQLAARASEGSAHWEVFKNEVEDFLVKHSVWQGVNGWRALSQFIPLVEAMKRLETAIVAHQAAQAAPLRGANQGGE